MKRLVAGLFMLNLAIRGVWVALLHPPLQSDFAFYFGAATRLAAGGEYTLDGHPTAYWPMGWPLLLSGFLRVFGPHQWVGLAVQVVLCSAIAVMVFLIARRISGSIPVGVVASLAWTLLPDQLAWTSMLGSEPLFTLLTMSGLYTLLSSSGRKRVVIAGVLLGAACWVRPTLVFLPTAVAIVFMLERRRVLVPLAEAAILAVVMLLVISPLTIRNYVVLGSPVLVSTNGGVALWEGVNTDERPWFPTDVTVNPLAALDDEAARDRLGQQLFLKHLVAHPGNVAIHAAHKFAALFRSPFSAWFWLHGRTIPADWLVVVTFSAVAYWCFMVVSLIGILIGWRRWRWPTLLLVSFLTYYTALFAFFRAEDRYRYPMMPVFAVFVGIALVTIAKEIRTRRQGPTGPGLKRP